MFQMKLTPFQGGYHKFLLGGRVFEISRCFLNGTLYFLNVLNVSKVSRNRVLKSATKNLYS